MASENCLPIYTSGPKLSLLLHICILYFLLELPTWLSDNQDTCHIFTTLQNFHTYQVWFGLKKKNWSLQVPVPSPVQWICYEIKCEEPSTASGVIALLSTPESTSPVVVCFQWPSLHITMSLCHTLLFSISHLFIMSVNNSFWCSISETSFCFRL